MTKLLSNTIFLAATFYVANGKIGVVTVSYSFKFCIISVFIPSYRILMHCIPSSFTSSVMAATIRIMTRRILYILQHLVQVVVAFFSTMYSWYRKNHHEKAFEVEGNK